MTTFVPTTDDVTDALQHARRELARNSSAPRAGSRGQHLPVHWVNHGDEELLVTRHNSILAHITVAPKVHPPLYAWKVPHDLSNRQDGNFDFDWDFDLDTVRARAATAVENAWNRMLHHPD